MATLETAVPIRAQTRSERLVRLLTRTPLHIALVGIDPRSGKVAAFYVN